MNLALWITQGLLAVGFLFAGLTKLFTPRDKLIDKMKMGWANDFSAAQVKQLGLAEVVGAIGLVLPRLVHIAPTLTPIAAACLAVLMVGASVTHLNRKEPPFASGLFALMSAFVAVGRFFLYA